MKRKGNIYDQFCSIDNLLQADRIARRGKTRQRGIKEFDKAYDQNIADIYRDLVTKTYRTSPYRYITIFETKERKISILPYRDRIVHHAAMNVLESVFVPTFTSDTYACIKGRGTHLASSRLAHVLRTKKSETRYCLKLDIKKFYPSIDNQILKAMLRRKIKDAEMLELLDGIIDSAPGLPIGNYLSQYLANFYLAYFDHWLKEVVGIKHYWRYADDMVILSHSKDELHDILIRIKNYLSLNLRLEVKHDHRIFPVRLGIDFVGYVHFPTHVLLRKTIKKAFARVVARRKRSNNHLKFKLSINSYSGWAKHCNSRHLLKKLIPNAAA